MADGPVVTVLIDWEAVWGDGPAGDDPRARAAQRLDDVCTAAAAHGRVAIIRVCADWTRPPYLDVAATLYGAGVTPVLACGRGGAAAQIVAEAARLLLTERDPGAVVVVGDAALAPAVALLREHGRQVIVLLTSQPAAAPSIIAGEVRPLHAADLAGTLAAVASAEPATVGTGARPLEGAFAASPSVTEAPPADALSGSALPAARAETGPLRAAAAVDPTQGAPMGAAGPETAAEQARARHGGPSPEEIADPARPPADMLPPQSSAVSQRAGVTASANPPSSAALDTPSPEAIPSDAAAAVPIGPPVLPEGDETAHPSTPAWMPRAQPLARNGAGHAAAGFRAAAPPQAAPRPPALATPLRRKLRDLLKRVAMPVNGPFVPAARREVIDGIVRGTTGIDARWPEFPDEVTRELLALYVCLIHHIQDHGVDHVTKPDLDAAFARLREFSRERYPGFVHGFAWLDQPQGSSWLDDAHRAYEVSCKRVGLPVAGALSTDDRIATALLQGNLTHATGTIMRAVPAAGSPDAARAALQVEHAAAHALAGYDALPAGPLTTLPGARHPPRICADAGCRRLAAALLDAGNSPLPVAKRRDCGICGGSNVARATAGLAEAMRAKGLRRLLVVGGDPTGQRQVTEQLAVYDIEVRSVDGAQSSPSEREASAHRAWADLIVIWTQGLFHKVSGHYSETVPGGPLVVWITKGGVSRLCADVTERLQSYEPPQH